MQYKTMAAMDEGIKRLTQTHPRDIPALALPEAEYLGARASRLALVDQVYHQRAGNDQRVILVGFHVHAILVAQ